MTETKMSGRESRSSDNIPEFKPDRIEVWSGIPRGETAEVWFVSLYEGEGEMVVFDGYSEADAMEAAEDCAEDWDIPIIVQHPPTLN
jgi:hypothetical protein